MRFFLLGGRRRERVERASEKRRIERGKERKNNRFHPPRAQQNTQVYAFLTQADFLSTFASRRKGEKRKTRGEQVRRGPYRRQNLFLSSDCYLE